MSTVVEFNSIGSVNFGYVYREIKVHITVFIIFFLFSLLIFLFFLFASPSSYVCTAGRFAIIILKSNGSSELRFLLPFHTRFIFRHRAILFFKCKLGKEFVLWDAKEVILYQNAVPLIVLESFLLGIFLGQFNFCVFNLWDEIQVSSHIKPINHNIPVPLP
uniref:Uncharacterized protein n=1 Tax=Cacopsylla melanoneura TaxID=428564 RepID=A0A8D8Y6H8_9HEMI